MIRQGHVYGAGGARLRRGEGRPERRVREAERDGAERTVPVGEALVKFDDSRVGGGQRPKGVRVEASLAQLTRRPSVPCGRRRDDEGVPTPRAPLGKGLARVVHVGEDARARGRASSRLRLRHSIVRAARCLSGHRLQPVARRADGLGRDGWNARRAGCVAAPNGLTGLLASLLCAVGGARHHDGSPCRTSASIRRRRRRHTADVRRAGPHSTCCRHPRLHQWTGRGPIWRLRD